METDVVHELTDGQTATLRELYRGTYWAAGREIDDVRRMLDETDVVVGVVDADSRELLAFARVLTDFVFRAFVEDVVVAEQYRGLGLGRRVMDAVVDHPMLAGVDSFTLGCRDDLVEFYEKWGFETAPDEMRLMNRLERS